jgi:GcrA cell cycle regulator
MTQSSTWTDERVRALTRLWRDGKSATEVARTLGGVTRNAVIGKVHRLGLGRRATPSSPRRAPSRPRVAKPRRAKPRAQRRLPPRPLPEALPQVGSATVATVRRGQCRWPIGEPGADDFRLCGAPACRGSYCAPHGKLAYRPATKRPPPDHLLRLAGLA